MSKPVLKILPGRPYPLGANYDGKGVNFALFSRNAEKVELCLFSPSGKREEARIEMPEYTDEVWHCYIRGMRPGQLYGYRVYGKYDPHRGHRFNGSKLLIDPYAKAMFGKIIWSSALFSYDVSGPDKDLSFSAADSAKYMPKCVVASGSYAWKTEGKPMVRRSNSIIYEAHVKGMTMRSPKVPAILRGTFDGLSHASVIRYLKDLGVTALEILPAQCFFLGAMPAANCLHDYWGYSTVNFFTPEPAYLRTKNINEFKCFVDRYHKAGLEVIMDVVYNHTGEGSHLGPALSFKGIDNAYYYRLSRDRRYYDDTTGTGNTLDFSRPRVVQMTMDSLRYWTEEMRVDGFRFDLAVALGREEKGFRMEADFYNAIAQDPVLQKTKKIAEPWDVGAGGYQLGNFPVGWSEWNGRYRDTARRFWRGDEGQAGDMATRFTGSSELFEKLGRRPWSTVNFVTAHDGFTLNDLVSYERKRNEPNGEGNRDGANENYSRNYGAEGPGDSAKINALRMRQMKNFLATLLLSQGLPMMLGGDEFARTQDGNNNGYLQDNRTSWFDWTLLEKNRELFGFAKRLVAIRKRHVVFHRSRFFKGQRIPGTRSKDIAWLRPAGHEMRQSDWLDPRNKMLFFKISGEAGDNFHFDKNGDPTTDSDFVVIMNASEEEYSCALPAARPPFRRWKVVFDTSGENPEGAEFGKESITARGQSFILLISAEAA